MESFIPARISKVSAWAWRCEAARRMVLNSLPTDLSVTAPHQFMKIRQDVLMNSLPHFRNCAAARD
jgi:hypothetical protein